MKKLSSVFYMWFGFGSAIVSVLAMFLPFINMDSGIKSATYFFFNGPGGLTLGAWPSFVGFMLILLAGLALGVMGLPFFAPTAKVEKIVLISSLAALVVGLALVASTGALYVYLNTEVIAHPSSPIIVQYNAGYFISLVAGILALSSNIVALLLDW